MITGKTTRMFVRDIQGNKTKPIVMEERIFIKHNDSFVEEELRSLMKLYDLLGYILEIDYGEPPLNRTMICLN